MSVALLAFYLKKTFCTRSSGFIDGDQRARRQLVLFGDTGDEARHLVGAAASASRNDKFNGFRGFPSASSAQWKEDEQDDKKEENIGSEFHFEPSFAVVIPGTRLVSSGIN